MRSRTEFIQSPGLVCVATDTISAVSVGEPSVFWLASLSWWHKDSSNTGSFTTDSTMNSWSRGHLLLKILFPPLSAPLRRLQQEHAGKQNSTHTTTHLNYCCSIQTNSKLLQFMSRAGKMSVCQIRVTSLKQPKKPKNPAAVRSFH